METGELLVAGNFIGGACDSSVAKSPVLSPWDGRTVGSIAEGGWEHMDAALSAAAEAFPAWARTPRFERSSLLRRAAALIRAHADLLVETAVAEIGKPKSLASGEVSRCALTFDLAASLLDSLVHEAPSAEIEPRGSGHWARLERFPRGVFLAITPYNWPYNLAAHKVAPALAAGNTVVLKPSGSSALCGAVLARVLHAAGFPTGVVNSVHCEPPVAERAAQDDRTKMVSFTGSEEVGYHIRGVVADKPVSLELGGDATAIVMPDADMDFAASRCALGGFGYAGQVCISVQHVLVHESVFHPMKGLLTQATENCPSGDPGLEATVCGPLIHASAADRVEAWISEAVQDGAELLAGGIRERNLIRPTLLTGVPSISKIGCEEVFGPVVTLERFSDLDQAVERVNSSRFGLQAGVFTSDIRTATRLFRDLEVGSLVVGDYPTLRLDNMPYGGTKRSGMGREGVRNAYEEATEPRVMLVRPD
ncbi:MAG: aldehyde dehydrogenase family protein [Fimbriimonadaceae bacterium]